MFSRAPVCVKASAVLAAGRPARAGAARPGPHPFWLIAMNHPERMRGSLVRERLPRAASAPRFLLTERILSQTRAWFKGPWRLWLRAWSETVFA
jgi:hypothetical protein